GVVVARSAWSRVGYVDAEARHGGEAAVAGLNGDGVTDGRVEIEHRPIGHGDDAGGTVDGKAAVGAVGEGVGDAAPARVDGGRGDADQGAGGGAFRHGIGAGIAVGRHRRGEVG